MINIIINNILITATTSIKNFKYCLKASMKKVLLIFLLSFTIASSDSLENLLEEYKQSNENSLYTADEKLGLVKIYSKRDIEIMQYSSINDILKELPNNTLHTDQFGDQIITNDDLDTPLNGYFKYFLNDHEISDVNTQTISRAWGNMSLDFIDHIEVYQGESTFENGSNTGIYFIKIYTKKENKDNGSYIKLRAGINDFSSFSFNHLDKINDDWSYLLFVNQQITDMSKTFNNEEVKNKSKINYSYINLYSKKSNITLSASEVKKDAFIGYSNDIINNDSNMDHKHYFLDFSHKFLEDESLKISASIDYNRETNYQSNDEGLMVSPIIDFTNTTSILLTTPKEFYDDIEFYKKHVYLSKDFKSENNKLLLGIDYKKNEYNVINRKSIDFFNITTNQESYQSFDEENIYSFLLQNDYKVNENLFLLANFKLDKYDRSNEIKDSNQKVYRIGSVANINKNIGVKAFYTKTYLMPTFNNYDFKSKYLSHLEPTSYDIFTVQSVFAKDNSKLTLSYDKKNIKDLIYLSLDDFGFINYESNIHTNSYTMEYSHILDKHKEVLFSFYDSNSDLSGHNKGAFVKLFGEVDKYTYFISLLYKDQGEQNNIKFNKAYDLSLGSSYNISKDISISFKAENILDKSTQSQFFNFSNTSVITQDDYGKKIYFSLGIKF